MEKPPSAGSPRQPNKDKKKQQIRVVYITNPMRVKTTAAEFKGLVQELTGQDSDIAERLCKFGEMEQADGGTASSAGRGSVSSDGSFTSTVARPPDSGNGEIHEEKQQQLQQRLPTEGKEMTPYDVMLDEDFPAQILEDFDQSFMPSTSYCESSPAVDDSKNLGTGMSNCV